MSDVPASSRARDPDYPAETFPAGAYPAETYPAETFAAEPLPPVTYEPATTAPGTGTPDQSKVKQVATQTKDAAAEAASDVRSTATEQAGRVGAEAKAQARSLASEVRSTVQDQARTQHDKLVGTIRSTADQLDEMRGDRAGSPAASVVSRVAQGGRQFADYLETNGPEGVLREVQDFARRRPGAFLATALAAGFVVGRLGKGVAKADSPAGDAKPAGDSYVATPSSAYPATGHPATGGTDYAATGTGTPIPVAEPVAPAYGDPGPLR